MSKLPENWPVEIALQILPLVILFYSSLKKSNLLFILKSNLFYLPRSLFCLKLIIIVCNVEARPRVY